MKTENGKNREKIIDSLILGFEKKLEIKLVPHQLTKGEVKLSQELRKVK